MLKAGESLEGVFLVVRRELVPFRDENRGCFLSLTLGNRQGTVEAVLWQGGEALFATLSPNTPVKVKGIGREFNGRVQLNLSEIESCPEAELGQLLPQGPMPEELLYQEVTAIRDQVQNRHLKWLLDRLVGVEERLRQFLAFPAAVSVHHAYPGGLAHHSIEVARLAETYCRFYPKIDRDLCLTGALLHDIGKVREYQPGYRAGVTLAGNLVGHTVIGNQMLEVEVAGNPGFPAELYLHLSHIILSHHGEMEYGAPVVPLTAEAMVIHMADLGSGRVNSVVNAAEAEDNWSVFDRHLGRRVYLGFLKGDKE